MKVNYMQAVSLFWESLNKREEQTWYLKHEDIFENNFFIIKKFTTREANEAIFINPPRAGHHSNIAQSVIKYYIEHTNYAVYSAEHKAATQETKNYGIEEIVQEVDIAFNCITESDTIHLAGLCQGGWANVMWASLNPQKTKSIVIAGTPINFTIDGGKCNSSLSFVNNAYIMNIINYHNGIWPGKKQLCGFKMLNPVDRYLTTKVELWNYITNEDEKNIKKWVRNNSWYEHTLDLPGKMIMEVTNKLFRENQLIDKKLELSGNIIDLSKITCPVVAITGDDDDITLERQCSAILDYVSSKDKIHFSIPECGHIAIFLKNTALEQWGKAIDFIKNSIEV